MTFNRRPGAPVVVAWNARLVMFARAPDDRLLHVWSAFEDFGEELLPGTLAGDPCVIAPTPNRLHVFARGVGSVLLHWRWDERDGRMGGPEILGRIAYDPVAVALSGRAIAVYARGATDALLVWGSPAPDTAWHDVRALEGAAITSKPAALYRPGAPLPDVFAAGGVRNEGSAAALSNTGSLMHWGRVHVIGSAVDRDGWEDLGGVLAGPPAAVSWSSQRIDVLAPLSPSGIDQWGWAGTQRYYDEQGVWHTGRWYGQDPGNVRGDFGGPAVAVSPGPDLAEVYARGPDGFLNAWLWDGTGGGFSPYSSWDGPIRVSGQRISSAPTALIDGGRARVYAWDENGRTLLSFIRNDAGSWDQRTWDFPWPSDVVVELADNLRVQPTVDYLVERPLDMVVLGVSWSGYQVTGNPLVLERTGGDDARLAVALPPQHIGEEVSPVPGPPWDPPVPAGVPAPFGYWGSVLPGPSQLVFAPDAERIELTTEGILAAMQGARIVPPSPDDPLPQTLIELPWQLLIAPAGDGVSEHRSSVVAAETGAAGLWRARLSSSEDSLDVVDGGGGEEGQDPFPMALSLGSRQLIAAQDGPAHLVRLELSALGGSLTAHGDWDAVSWEHDASLARDHRVRVQVSGVLYPFGHRAEYIELTERFPAEPDAEPIAMLRTSRFLRVTEPVRGRPAYPELARAFPFDSVEIVTREFSIDEPWATADRFLRRRRPPEELQETLRRLNDKLLELRLGSEGGGEPPVMENEALNPFSDLATIAEEYLRLIEAIQRTQEQIAAVMELGDEEMPWFFCPRHQGIWVTVTAQCRSGTTSIDLQLPVLFVVDQQLPETDTMLGFDSLRDDDIGRKLATKWVAIRRQVGAGTPPEDDPDSIYAGVAGLPAVPLDLIRAGRAGDIQVVDGLNITGTLRERAIYPRFGPDPLLPATDPPSAPSWGMKVELPTLRSLLPDHPESHHAPVSFSDEYLARGPDEDIALKVVKAGGLLVDFTKNAERSGGLVSPKIKVDAISRETGPVNLQGLVSHNPEDYFEPDATLLGFPLALLLDGLDVAPTITTDLTGPQPIVELAWKKDDQGVPLDPPEDSPFTLVDDPPTPTTPKPTLTLTVRTCGPDATTNCEVTNFALSFPTKSPLLTLKFKSLTYNQTAGAAPTLDVKGIQASFSGALDLLQTLQEKVSLGGSTPAISVTSDGVVASYTLPVPDAAAGAFVMRNLAFRAGVVVPFRGEPVSVSVGFASRSNPFNLSVLALGGGGYVDLELSRDGLRRLEVSLEFGASVAVDFVVASGEAHVLGGIRFELLPDESVLLTGYLRIGGSLEVLGLVSVSVELVLSLGYQTTGNRLVGRATLVLEIDLTLFSESVELDSGEWEIAGGERDRDPNAPPEPPFAVPSTEEADPFLAAWRAHRRAFEPVS